MKRNWLLAICIAILAALVHVEAMPSRDAFVISNSNGEATEAADAATEEPDAPIKMMEMSVKSEVSLRYAHTAVVTRVRNPARRAQQTTFHVLLPETAFISGFVMTLSGKSYDAYVKEKEEAKKIYSDAVSHGYSAAHVSTKARNSNHFTVSVNVEPQTEAMFNLTYEELLVRRNGVYNHIINLHPGALVPKMKVTVHIKESQEISVLRVPEVRTGNEVDATDKDAQNSKATILKDVTAKEATITFSPDLEEQTQLMQIYKEKTRASPSSSHNWQSSDNDEDNKSSTVVLGQFVVQYDVKRPEKGEILVNDGYFVHFFAPQSLKPLNKHVVFVLDTSGSMMGRKIEQLKEAMAAILYDLHPNDYFSIVEFNSYVQVHKLAEADQEPSEPRYDTWRLRNTKPELEPPSHASVENIAKAQTIISRLYSTGGTNIHSALETAVEIVNKKIKAIQTETGAIGNVIENSKKVNLEPLIIFLTDGDANMGETDPKRIVSSITEKNSEAGKAVIYSLAFGDDADRDMLRKLSLRNEGFMRHIYEGADAALQLKDFYRQISSPLLSQVKFNYPPEQIKEASLTQHKYNIVFLGSEVVVAGQLAPGATELVPQVQAYSANENNLDMMLYEVIDRVIVEEKKNFLPLERLWAYLTIKQLLDEKDAKEHDDIKEPNRPEKRALDIALKYSFVTPLTSLVVVKPNDTSAVDAESVDKTSSAVPHYSYTTSRSLMFSAPDVNRLASKTYAMPSFVPLALDVARYPGNFGYQHFGFQTLSLDSMVNTFDEEDILTSDTKDSVDSVQTLPTTTESLEDIFHLNGYSWALSLLNSDSNSLEFMANGKNVTLEISKSTSPPKDDVDSECTVSSEASASKARVCVYLTRCVAAKDIESDHYRDTYCTVQNKYAGVCCPISEVITIT